MQNCNIKRGVKCYFDKKDQLSVPQKTYYDENRDKLLQKQND